MQCEMQLRRACHFCIASAGLTCSAIQVYLALYRAERYIHLVRPLGIWPYPRGHHRHMARLPWRNATLLLADQRFCQLLPPQRRLLPSPGLRALPAERATSCDAACKCAARLYFLRYSADSLRSIIFKGKGQVRTTVLVNLWHWKPD